MSNLLARILTRSFPGKAETPLGPGLQDPAEQGAQQPESHDSRAFALWNECLPAGSGRILELGCLHPDTLQFFQARGAQLAVQALDTSAVGTAFEMQLTEQSARDFRGVLAWDLPNYLDAGELTVLGQWLAERCQPGCPLLACLASRAPYADRPGQYAIADEQHLRFSHPPGATEGRRLLHTSSALARAFAGFSTERSFLLRNGMQEYVLKRH